MKRYFGYIRVSTPKQGERGSSLQEQKSAIEIFARQHDMAITEWFEERETAAKLGRPVFSKMMEALTEGAAVGVITHKIDRSARNLRDWAALGELVDRGVELHFAHESIDLTSRGGRLAADIQAVVAADYIRNLRDEVRKGLYGRLKQGLYPLRAPLGYLDMGRATPKAVDPGSGPLIRAAFELYASGEWSLDTLRHKLHSDGLRNRAGGKLTRNGLATVLTNPFYTGLIRLRSTGEVYQGVHPPLVTRDTFEAVQSVLHRKSHHRVTRRKFRYQRLLTCSACGYRLIAERQKGHVYYRCHSTTCSGTSVREEAVDRALCSATGQFKLTEIEVAAVRSDIEGMLAKDAANAERKVRGLDLGIAAIDERLSRLTEAYLDRVIDREGYLQRKESLLSDRLALQSEKSKAESGEDDGRERVEKILELVKSLSLLTFSDNHEKLARILKEVTSNLVVQQKEIAVTWFSPFAELAKSTDVTLGEHHRAAPRTERAQKVAEIIMAHCIGQEGANENSRALLAA